MFSDLKILVLDDIDTGAAIEILTVLLPGVNPVSVGTVRGAIDMFAREYWDIVILDLKMEKDPDFAGRADQSSAGFYAYFWLYRRLSALPHGQLAPLVILYTGNDDIKDIMRPFFLEDPGFMSPLKEGITGGSRPFVIISKGDKAFQGFKEALLQQELDRFMQNWHLLGTGNEAIKKLDTLAQGTVPKIVTALGEIEMSREINFKKVFPVHLARVQERDADARTQLAHALKSQDFLSKLNYLFQPSAEQPGYHFLHNNLHFLDAFVKQIGVVPPKTKDAILSDLNLVASGDFLEMKDRADEFKITAERFKAQWSRWDCLRYVFKSNGSTYSLDTLPSLVMQQLENAAGTGKVRVCWKGTNVAEEERLYLDPHVLSAVVQSIAENACKHAEASVLARVFFDRVQEQLHLDIADDGPGFEMSGREFATLAFWAKELRGWAEVSVFSRSKDRIYVWRSGIVTATEWPDPSEWGEETPHIGTLIRISLKYRSHWGWR